MKLKIILMSFLLAGTASADFLTKDNGQVISIPEGYNAAPYDKQWNPRGVNEEGNFPSKAFADALAEKFNAWALETDFPTKSECAPGQLTLGAPDVRCRVYDY